MKRTCFFLLLSNERHGQQACLAIQSLRSFGGSLRNCPIWLFKTGPGRAPSALNRLGGVAHFSLTIPAACREYPFAAKVAACAAAEALAGPDLRSLVWLSLDTLVVNPPLLFDLAGAGGIPPAGVAFRPVHHRNIGSPAGEPPDLFWQEIFARLEAGELPYTVTAFADGQVLRPYFNTHCFAFNPAHGLMQLWWQHFKELVSDQAFQAGPCRDGLHKIFLHQAILSTLVAKTIPWERVRLLPPTYNYPLNLLAELRGGEQVPALNDLVSAVYEETFPWNELEIREPLRSWLAGRLPAGILPPREPNYDKRRTLS